VDAPKPTGDLVEPPAHLTQSQQAVWREAIENAPPGMLKKIDRSVFQSWVIAVDTVENIRQMVARLGVIVKSPGGAPIVNPLLREQRGQANLVRQLAAELGFSPTARPRVKISKSDQSKGNAFEGLKGLDD
jgi:P27 family predicted phage terminase small subunit